MTSTSSQNEWTLRARFQEGLLIKIFLMGWLAAWAVGEVVTLLSLAPHARWILAHWRGLFPAIPRGGSVLFPIAPGNREDQLFAAGWLVTWTAGGVWLGGYLSGFLFGTDIITLDAATLTVHRQLGPFRWWSRLPRESIKWLAVSPNGHVLIGGHVLFAETSAKRFTISRLGTRAEREQAAAGLQAILGTLAPATSVLDVTPAGWSMAAATDDWKELVRSGEAFRPAVMQGTLAVALLIAAVAPEAISPLSFLHGTPQWFALLGAAAAAYSAFRTMGLAKRIRIRAKELVVVSGPFITLEEQHFSRPSLCVTCDEDDSTEVYTLWAEEGGRRAKLLVSRGLAGPALELGEWLAARMEVKLQLPAEFDRNGTRAR